MNDRPEPAVEAREIPPDVADAFQVALGLPEPPATLGEWVDATAGVFEEAGISVGVDELCLIESSRHEARIGDETYHFACVLDTFLLPFVADDPTTVDVRSTSPVSGAEIELEVTPEGVSADPEEAVVSIGAVADVASPDERDEGEDLPAYGYEAICPCINAFADETEYEAWADATPAAVTVALPAADAFALARSLAREVTT